MHTGMPCVCCRTQSAPPPSTYRTCPSRLPIKTLHREHRVLSIPTAATERETPQKPTGPNPPCSYRPVEPPQLIPPFRRTSPHINRHDHQTGQADTWILPPPPEASCRRGADAATGPCRQPDSHDAGHHGPEYVLLQCQTDDGEGPGPACTLNRL